MKTNELSYNVTKIYIENGITPTRQEKQEAAWEHAKYILECVQYSIQKHQ